MPLSPGKRSEAHERRLAKEYRGSRNAGSGNGWVRKGDVRTVDTLIEHKYTDKKQYILREADLQKNWMQAVVDSRTGIFIVTFPETEWVVLKRGDYDTLVGDDGGQGSSA